MRTSTIILSSLTVVFGAATIGLAILVSPGNLGGVIETLRVGGLVTVVSTPG